MSPRRLAPLLACCLAAASCDNPPAPPASTAPSARWPDLPRTPEAAAALLRARTLRDTAGVADADLEADALLARAEKLGWARLVAGDDHITAHLQAFLDRAVAAGRDAVILWGTFHDAPGQIDAFRRLIGPGGLRGLTLIAAEQFRRDGAWAGAPPDLQRGDDADLAAWITRGDRAAFDRLARAHHETDYAAWKFGYEPAVMDLLVTARALAASPSPGDPPLAVAGCDMPKPLQAELAALSDDDRLRLRELHCVAGLPPSPRRAALLWGQAHVRARALPRFLPPSTAVLAVYVVGHRSGPWTTEAALRDRLALADPILIPLTADEVAIVYPDPALGAAIDRARSDDPAPPGLHVRVEGGGRLLLGDRAIALGDGEQQVTPAAGEATWVIEQGPLHVVGALRPRGALELTVDPKQRSITAIEHP